jgi:hypothetical protein
MATGSK